MPPIALRLSPFLAWCRSSSRPIRGAALGVGLLLTLAGLSLTGCAHYQLGTGSPTLGFRTIYVGPVENQSTLPQAVAPLSRELRAAFVRDGRVALATSAETADVVLHLSLREYSRSFTAVLPADTALARKFDLHLNATCSLTDQRTGTVLFADRPIAVTRQIFVDGGQNAAEGQAVPHLASELADRVLHAVLDVW